MMRLLLLCVLTFAAMTAMACNEDAGKVLCRIRGCEGPSRL